MTYTVTVQHTHGEDQHAQTEHVAD